MLFKVENNVNAPSNLTQQSFYNAYTCQFARVSCLLVSILTVHFFSSQHCYFYGPKFMAIAYCSSIYYILIRCRMLKSHLVWLTDKASVLNTWCVSLCLFISVLCSLCTESGLPLMSDTHNSWSASLEHQVHWVWEIISDLLEKARCLS